MSSSEETPNYALMLAFIQGAKWWGIIQPVEQCGRVINRLQKKKRLRETKMEHLENYNQNVDEEDEWPCGVIIDEYDKDDFMGICYGCMNQSLCHG